MLRKIPLLLLSVFVATSAAYGLSKATLESLSSLETPNTINEFSDVLPESHHPRSLLAIQNALKDMHLAGYRVDKKFARNVFDDFIDYLDPNKMLVIEKDYVYISKYLDSLSSDIIKGNLSFAFTAFTMIEQDREKMLHAMLSYIKNIEDSDIQYGTTLSKRSEKSERFKDKAARLDYWKLVYQSKLLGLMSEGSTFADAKDELVTLLNNQIKYFDHADSEDIFTYFTNVLMNNVEAHTRYDSPISARQTYEMTSNQIFGIGAQLSVEDFFITIADVMPDSPAELSGELSSGDRIIAVKSSKDAEWVPVTGMRLSKATDLIKGQENTPVGLRIAKENKSISNTIEVEILRKPIQLTSQTVSYKVYDAPYNEVTSKIGIVTIPSFYDDVSKDVANALFKLGQQNIDGIIVDLRDNGGGLLTEGQKVASLFLDGGSVVKTRSVDGNIRTLKDIDLDNEYKGNLSVLVNRYSASASEIVAGAIQDHNRGIIIGETTFGKGTVQSYFSLDNFRNNFQLGDADLGSIAITQAKFYRPSGHSTQHKGVIPDINILGDLDSQKWGESKYDSALPWDNLKVDDFEKPNKMIDLTDVKERSKIRVSKNESMQHIINNLRNSTSDKVDSVTLDVEAIKRKRELVKAKKLDYINGLLSLIDLPPVDDDKDVDEKIKNVDVVLDEAVRIFNEILTATQR